jgi:hypothetical protein
MIRPANFYEPVNAIYNLEDPAIGKYSTQCSERDYFSPLPLLMQEAAGSKKGLEEQNVWIVNIYEKIISQKITDPTHSQIALQSAPKLIEVLNALYNGQSYAPFYKVVYDTAYKNPRAQGSSDKNLEEIAKISCLDINSVIRAIGHLSGENFSEQLNLFNPISFFIAIWEISTSILWEEHFSKLQGALLKGALQKIYPGMGEVYQTYLNLFPIVSNLFNLARNRCFALNVLPSDDDQLFDRSPRGNRNRVFCQLL